MMINRWEDSLCFQDHAIGGTIWGDHLAAGVSLLHLNLLLKGAGSTAGGPAS